MDAKSEFSYLDDWDVPTLHAERQRILDGAPGGDFQQLDDDSLTKLWAIMRALRRKAHVSARRPRVSRTPSLEDLA